MKNGIILIDKPSGITTFDVIRALRKKLGIRKMGHAGVLDKMATGLVVVGVNKATKLLSIFENGDKIYEAEFTFGIETDTYDLYGRVLDKKEIDKIEKESLTEILKHYIGEIEQTPPPFSNVKIKGKRSYEYALKKEQVELPKRKVKIYSLELLELNGNRAKFRIKCSKGTYIRSLAHDMGAELGSGAIVSSLKRIYIHPFSLEQASTISEPQIVPLDEALKFMDEIVIDHTVLHNIKNGYPICKLINCSKLKEKYYRLIDDRTNTVAVIEKSGKNYIYRAIFQ